VRRGSAPVAACAPRPSWRNNRPEDGDLFFRAGLPPVSGACGLALPQVTAPDMPCPDLVTLIVCASGWPRSAVFGSAPMRRCDH